MKNIKKKKKQPDSLDLVDQMNHLDTVLVVLGNLCESHNPSVDLPGQLVADIGQLVLEYLRAKRQIQGRFTNLRTSKSVKFYSSS